MAWYAMEPLVAAHPREALDETSDPSCPICSTFPLDESLL